MEIQQSPLFADYIKTLKWTVVSVDGTNIFLRKIPIQGTLAKIQRPTTLPSIKKLLPILAKYRVRKVVAEADALQNPTEFNEWCNNLRKHVNVTNEPYLPTKTILVDLTAQEAEIFSRFTEAKRRAVRRALKNNLQIYQSTNIEDLIRIKNKSAGFLGFLTTFGIKKLWPIFGPHHAAILLAYSSNNNKVFGGVLLLFWEDIAYYWIAGATREGKKLFAPTLLVWEALKLAKIRGAKQFDFVGVWDERLPRQYDSWKGFTKFKEGFGGKTIYYPIAMLHK